MYGSHGEALQLCAVYKNKCFLLQVTQEPVSVPQVMCTAFEHAMNSNILMIKCPQQQTHGTFFYSIHVAWYYGDTCMLKNTCCLVIFIYFLRTQTFQVVLCYGIFLTLLMLLSFVHQTCIIRAWDPKRPLLYCPAMNTYMWDHPLTSSHLHTLTKLGYIQVPPVTKILACGDQGTLYCSVDKTVI